MSYLSILTSSLHLLHSYISPVLQTAGSSVICSLFQHLSTLQRHVGKDEMSVRGTGRGRQSLSKVKATLYSKINRQSVCIVWKWSLNRNSFRGWKVRNRARSQVDDAPLCVAAGVGLICSGLFKLVLDLCRGASTTPSMRRIKQHPIRRVTAESCGYLSLRGRFGLLRKDSCCSRLHTRKAK